MSYFAHMLKEVKERIAGAGGVQAFLSADSAADAKARIHLYRHGSPARPLILLADRPGSILRPSEQADDNPWDITGRIAIRFERPLNTEVDDDVAVIEWADLLDAALESILSALHEGTHFQVASIAATSELRGSDPDEAQSAGSYLTRDYSIDIRWVPPVPRDALLIAVAGAAQDIELVMITPTLFTIEQDGAPSFNRTIGEDGDLATFADLITEINGFSDLDGVTAELIAPFTGALSTALLVPTDQALGIAAGSDRAFRAMPPIGGFG